MRKSILSVSEPRAAATGTWFDLENIATVEISSEDPLHNFEMALRSEDDDGGWRAAVPGPQQIRLKFDSPQYIHRIRLIFREEKVERAQEFTVAAISSTGARHEVVRQQWTFSPGGSTTEVEEYAVDLPAISVVELKIDPGRHDKQVFASLEAIGIA